MLAMLVVFLLHAQACACNAVNPSQEAVSLCTALRGNSQLTELYASNHEMNAQTAAVVSDLLAATSTLKMLCLGDAAFGDAGLAALAPGLQANQSLTRLDLESKVRGFHYLLRYMLTIFFAHKHRYATCLTCKSTGVPAVQIPWLWCN